MSSSNLFSFGEFLLDPGEQRLSRGPKTLKLTPKALSLLHYFARNSRRLVGKEELLSQVWPEAIVGDGALKVCVREIRKALGDDPKKALFIETVHRHGYRFLAEVIITSTSPSTRSGDLVSSAAARPPRQGEVEEKSLHDGLVGCEGGLSQLQDCWRRALSGRRQVVFVTGEPGIGKTALVSAFVPLALAQGEVLLARGQCLEQYGAGEAYLPVLSALGRLCRGPDRVELLGVLRQYAPTWLVHLPGLVDGNERDDLHRETLGATRERMLREMAEALEVVSEIRPLLLILEDLHWSDYSTLDLISLLASREEAARIQVVTTYRPVDVILSQHPLRAVKQQLEARRLCQEIVLDRLDELTVGKIIQKRGRDGAQPPRELVQSLHQRTGGNPLFLINVLDYLNSQGLLQNEDGSFVEKPNTREIRESVPQNVREMIDIQVSRLSSEQQKLLEAASVAGIEFSSLALASALDDDVLHVEEMCEELDRGYQFLRRLDVRELPDGTVTGRYGFTHSLYQSGIYARVAPARRNQFHLRIGVQGEAVYGDQVGEIAAELALHFEEGRDLIRAIHYRLAAADRDHRRFANREAIGHLTHALSLADRLPGEKRLSLRLGVLRERGLVRRSMGDMKGAVEDFEELVTCASDGGQVELQVKSLLYLVSVLWWVGRDRCLASSDEAIALSEQLGDDLLRAHTRGYCGHWNLNLRGYREEDMTACQEAIEAARDAGEPALLSLHVTRFTYALCQTSEYERACETAAWGLPLAQEVGDAFDYLLCQFFRSWALLHRGEWGEFLSVVDEGARLAEKNDHLLWSMLFRVIRAHLYAETFDFEVAAELAQTALLTAEEDLQGTGQLFFHSLIVLGLASLGRGDLDHAWECFDRVYKRAEEGGLMDWLLYMPLHNGLSEYWLMKGDLARSRREADSLLGLARRSGETTYHALGLQLYLRLATVEEDWETAWREYERACEVLSGPVAPLAAWRTHAAGATLFQRWGKADEERKSQDLCRQVFEALAASLQDHPRVRKSFLSHPTVRSTII